MKTILTQEVAPTGLIVGILEFKNITNKKNPNGPLEKQIKSLVAEVKENREAFLTLPSLSVYTAFSESAPPSLAVTAPAPKILVDSITQRGQLPTISRVVDSMNVVSVRTGLTISAWAGEAINGDITYRFSSGGERYWPFMGEEVMLLPGELIAEDEEKVLCLFRYRDSQYAPVRLETENIIVHIQGITGISEAEIRIALDTLATLLLSSVGGEVVTKEIVRV